MSSKRFAVIGGDLRNLSLAKKLRQDGADVKLYGFSAYEKAGFAESCSLEDAIKDTDYIIGATPCSLDKETLNAPFSGERHIYISDIFKVMTPKQLFFAGRISDCIKEKAESLNIKAFDILECDGLATMNAIPTAEGAIKIAIEETEITLHNANALVIGYGRIGKVLSKILEGFSANVYVAVRKREAFAEVRGQGYHAIRSDYMEKYLPEMDFVFNTVPQILLDSTNLHLIKRSCLILDMASKPFGVDREASSKLGLKVLWTPSLPGKIAPETVAEYIKETVYSIIEEEERC